MTKDQIKNRITNIDRISKSIFFKDILVNLDNEKKDLENKLKEMEE